MGLALVLIVALAAGFRLYHLGVPAFRADTIIFYQLCHQPESGWYIFTHWTLLGHFPFPMAITKGFIDIFHLPITDFMIRLPNAVFGILTVLDMYLLGRQMAGRATAGLFVGRHTRLRQGFPLREAASTGQVGGQGMAVCRPS